MLGTLRVHVEMTYPPAVQFRSFVEVQIEWAISDGEVQQGGYSTTASSWWERRGVG